MGYDPFAAGPHEVSTRTIVLQDRERDRALTCDIWEPAGAEPAALVAYSHSSGGNRRSSSFLCEHLAGHGYRVAALDHSELVAHLPEDHEARIAAVIAGRVPDLRLLLDRLADGPSGLAGHSFGGWTVLATAEADERVRAVVAMGPGGTSPPKPGILPVTLRLDWPQPVATLYLAAEDDALIPLDGVLDTQRRTPPPSRVWVLRRADHQHFVDDVEREHEALRTAQYPPEMSWIGEGMRPIGELVPAGPAHTFTRGLALAHFDAELRGLAAAREFWAGDVAADLSAHGVDAFAG